MVDSIYFVSLGPGDPELITVKGLKRLHDKILGTNNMYSIHSFTK